MDCSQSVSGARPDLCVINGLSFKLMWESIATDLRPAILVRVALTLIAGCILGAERERHGRAAGLRMTILVSLSACVAMIISDSFYVKSLDVTGGCPCMASRPRPTCRRSPVGHGISR